MTSPTVQRVFQQVAKEHGFIAYGRKFAKPISKDLYGMVWLERSRFSDGYYVEVGIALRSPEAPTSKSLVGGIKTRLKPSDAKLAFSMSSLEESFAKVAEPTLRRLAEWAFTFVEATWRDEIQTAMIVLSDDVIDVWGDWPHVDLKAWAVRRLEQVKSNTRASGETSK